MSKEELGPHFGEENLNTPRQQPEQKISLTDSMLSLQFKQGFTIEEVGRLAKLRSKFQEENS